MRQKGCQTKFVLRPNTDNIDQGALKNGAGTASSPRFVSTTAFYGDEPSPLAHSVEHTLIVIERSRN